jgi:hypothetical protein
VAVVREIVARFLMASIGYEGQYASFLGGWHLTRFPPAVYLEDETKEQRKKPVSENSENY